MFSLLMAVFFFIAITIIGALISIGLLFSRKNVIRPQERQERRDDPNIIDVQALDDDQTAEITSTDQLLKP